MKSIALAAIIAASSFSASNAASILDPLKLTVAFPASFATDIDTHDGFWSAFLGVFGANGYDSVVNAFSDDFGFNFDPDTNDVAFNKPAPAPTAWLGYLTFNGANKSVTFASFTGSTANPTVAVPGPEAGAGLGALLLGGMALWVARRRNSAALAA